MFLDLARHLKGETMKRTMRISLTLLKEKIKMNTPHLSLRTLLVACFSAICSISACGGGDGTDENVCVQAGDVLKGCGFEDDSSQGTPESDCNGDARTQSQCVVDFPDEACAYFENFEDNAFSDCLGG